MAKNDASKRPSKSDERNLVESTGVDLEHMESELVLLWEKNRSTIIYGILAGIAVFLAFHGYRYMGQRSDLQAQADYAAASDSTSKLAFAEAESGRPLSGLAFKELGDEAYAAADYATAEKRYRSAAASTKSAIQDAAKIGIAMSLLAQGEVAKAKSQLQALADNASSAAQGEATYRLAVMASEAGDLATARTLSESLDGVNDYYWKSMAEELPGVSDS